MISIIYPYRNRDLKRVQRSFESLNNQTIQDFEVYFVDYGSEPKISEQVRKLCEDYPKIKYIHHATRFQPWNKAKALNSVIKSLETEFCFVADIDMIFHPEFIKTAISLQQPKQTVYFKVSFSESGDKLDAIKPEDFDKFRNSDHHATGLTMFSVKALKSINGFDEFYHLWGAEDTDVHVRLRNAGLKVQFYEEEILMLHQWHKSYRVSEKTILTENYQLSDIALINHEYLKQTQMSLKTKVNLKGWGNIQNKSDVENLENEIVSFTLTNKKCEVDSFLYGFLPSVKQRIIKVEINLDTFQKSNKYYFKKMIGRKVPIYYTLKEINDEILLNVISFYRDNCYIYKINKKENKLLLAIKFD